MNECIIPTTKADQEIKLADKNNEYLNSMQQTLMNVHYTEEKKILEPNWPSFMPIIHYNPSELIYPFNLLVSHSFNALLFLILSFFYNIFSLTQVDLSCFSFSRSLFLSLVQGFTAIYFCYAFSYRYLYCACIIRHIPYRFIFYQFSLIFWCIYVLIGFCQTGFAGLATLFNAVFENGEDDYLSIYVIASNCIISVVSLILNCITLHTASNAKKLQQSNYHNKRKNIETNFSML